MVNILFRGLLRCGSIGRAVMLASTTLTFSSVVQAAETFFTIQRVNGNQIAVVPDAGEAGRGMRGGGGTPPGQPGMGMRRRPGDAAVQPTILTVPPSAKITSATRERRTFEFRVGAELAGGLKHRVFQEMQAPLTARIVTDGNRITEINVIIPESDINQSSTTASGQAVIAVRPKRPPTKSPSATGASK
jgi:hypothetical protein